MQQGKNWKKAEVKWTFGQWEIIVDKHLYGPYGWMPSLGKVDVIQEIKEELESQIKVQRFLGACVFYHNQIPNYAHVVELAQKGKKVQMGIRTH